MSIKTKRVLILLFDALFAILLSILFSTVITVAWQKVILSILIATILFFRILLDWKIVTQEEKYYGKILKQIDAIEDHKYQVRASIHKKMLIEIKSGNTKNYLTLKELYEQVGIK